MTSPDDHFREFFRSVTPTTFSACPVPPAIEPSSIIKARTQRSFLANRAVLAITASILFAFVLTFSPSAVNRKPDVGENSLLKDATANGKGLLEKKKSNSK